MKIVCSVLLLVILEVSSSPFENDLEDGYEYPKPSCPLVYPSTITTTIPLLDYVTINQIKTETIFSVLKPTTIFSTIIEPTTTTEISRLTDFVTETDYRTLTSTATKTLPPITEVSTSIQTQWKTVSYPVTETEVSTETQFQTETETRFSTKTSTLKLTQTATLPVTTTLTTTVCAADNAYLPPLQDPTCSPPPQTYLPADILPPELPTSTTCETATRTVTSTLFREAPAKTTTQTITVQQPTRSAAQQRRNNANANAIQPTATTTKYVMKDVVTVTKTLTRTSSVLLYDQRVTQRVSVTPTLTSYIYLGTVTRTVQRKATQTVVV